MQHRRNRSGSFSAVFFRLHTFQFTWNPVRWTHGRHEKAYDSAQIWKRLMDLPKYKIDRLMYFETYTESKIAALREKQIKKFRREKKIALFAGSNPEWKDLTPELFQTIGIPPLRQAQGRDFRKSKTASPSNQP
jgi:hypothetical protein